jgi:hypothetical protein
MTFDRRAMGKVGISIIQSMNACLKGVGNNKLLIMSQSKIIYMIQLASAH